MVTHLSQVYIDIIKAFRADCDMLIKRFRKEENRDIQTFLKLWHKWDFRHVYERKYSRHGMQYDFRHDTLQIAKLIMLQDHFVGGMFLMYGLYCLQDGKGTIRLEHGEFNLILGKLRSKQEDSKGKNTQLALLFATLLKKNAFDYVLFGREYDIEGQQHAEMIYNKKYEFPDDENDENPKSVNPQSLLRNIVKDIPKAITDLDVECLKIKNKIRAVYPFLKLSLTMVQEDISTSVLNCQADIKEVKVIKEPKEVKEIDIGAKRRSLKYRKMKIKQRYQKEGRADDEPCESSVKARKRAGWPKGMKKYYLDNAINDPDGNISSDDGSGVEQDVSQISPKKCLPRL